MSKWRPSEKNCLYVIPDIQGAFDLLQKIFDRILPLRKSDGGKDMLVLLGDYVDRHRDSHKVLDLLIQIKKEYSDQVVCIKGNHEQIFLAIMNKEPGKEITLQSQAAYYNLWIANGGYETLIGYMDLVGIKDVLPNNLPRFRIADIVPKEHIEFLQTQLVNYYEKDNFIFMHGGCDPSQPMNKQDPSQLYWDRDLVKKVKSSIAQNKPEEIFWDKTIVTGHNGATPVIHEKFMMLDCGSPDQLLVVELNSMEAFMSYPNKNRLVKYELKETVAGVRRT